MYIFLAFGVQTGIAEAKKGVRRPMGNKGNLGIFKIKETQEVNNAVQGATVLIEYLDYIGLGLAHQQMVSSWEFLRTPTIFVFLLGHTVI